MAREAPHLALLLLLLLVSSEGQTGLWAQNQRESVPDADVDVDVVWAVQGQDIAVKCLATPFQKSKYEPKIWCRRNTTKTCTPLITSSAPKIMKRKARYFLWDNPEADLFIVIVSEIKTRDTGYYWCGTSVANAIRVSKRIKLVVTEEVTPVRDPSGSEHGWYDSNVLVLLLCVLFLVTKVLLLISLLTVLTCRALGFTSTAEIMATTAPNLA